MNGDGELYLIYVLENFFVKKRGRDLTKVLSILLLSIPKDMSWPGFEPGPPRWESKELVSPLFAYY
jgi:hypothetical protein